MEILKNPNNMCNNCTKKCNNCPSAEWRHVYAGEYNLVCNKLNKTVEYGIIKETDEIEAPIWCPKTFGQSSTPNSGVRDVTSDIEIPSTTPTPKISEGFRGSDGKWYTLASNGLLRCEDGNCYLQSEVQRPSSNSSTDTSYTQQIKVKRIMWGDVKPRVNWNAIQVNDIYHVPPHMGKERFDIKITGIYPSSVSYSIVGNSTYTTFHLYRDDLIFKLMVEKK